MLRRDLSAGQHRHGLDGSAHASLASDALFQPGLNPYSLTLIIKGTNKSLYPPAQSDTYVWATTYYNINF